MNENRQVPEPEDLHAPTPGEDIANAEAEAEALDKKIDIERKGLAYLREKAIQKVIDWWTRLFIRVVFGSIVLSVIIFVWHFLFPEEWHWVSKENLIALKSFIFSSAVLGAFSKQIQKYI